MAKAYSGHYPWGATSDGYKLTFAGEQIWESPALFEEIKNLNDS